MMDRESDILLDYITVVCLVLICVIASIAIVFAICKFVSTDGDINTYVQTECVCPCCEDMDE